MSTLGGIQVAIGSMTEGMTTIAWQLTPQQARDLIGELRDRYGDPLTESFTAPSAMEPAAAAIRAGSATIVTSSTRKAGTP